MSMRTFNHTVLRRAAVVLTTAALVLGSATAAGATTEAGKYAVTGTVAAPDGTPLEGKVTIWRKSGASLSWIETEFFTGDLALALVPGEYVMQFADLGGQHVAEFYNDAASSAGATSVVVTTGDQVLDPIVLTPVPTITGRVVTSTGRPAGHVQVGLFQAGTPSNQTSTTTGADGRFRLTAPPGDWKIRVHSATIAGTWYPAAATHDEAEVISLAPAEVEQVGDVVVGSGGSISGRVRAADGDPLQRIRVVAVDASGLEVRVDDTNIHGRFDLPSVSGPLRIRLQDASGEYNGEWFEDAANFASATPVVVGTGQQVDLGDAVLAAAPVVPPVGVDLSGTVRDSAGRAVAGATVRAWARAAGGELVQLASGTTNRKGHYWFDQLDGGAPRQVVVNAYTHGPTELDEVHLTEGWHGGRTRADAEPVSVVPGEVAEGVDIRLELRAGVSGRIVDGNGDPVRGGVHAFDHNGERVGDASMDERGRYAIRDLEPGVAVKLRFVPQDDEIAEWYPDASSFITARAIVPTAGQFVTADMVVTTHLATVTSPTLTGSPTVGTTLAVTPPEWNVASGVEVDYEWRRGSTVLATGRSYTAAAGDAGSPLTVRMTARHEDHLPGSVTVSTAPIRHTSTTTVTGKVTAAKKSGKKGGKKGGKGARATDVRLTVRVSAPATSSGTVTVSDGARVVGTASVSGGTATLVLRKQKPGRHTYVATYAGNGTVAPSSGSVAVKVKR